MSSALLLMMSSVIVKAIGAVYKIPLTSFIGAVGRGYFASAYNVYLPLHALIMGAFPVALSKLVSACRVREDTEALAALQKGARRLFVKVGIIGTALMLLAAKPYSVLVAGAPACIYTVLVLAPSIFFSALAASYRGIYEGCMNMRPTAVSQMLEAFFKMVLGLIFARVSMVYLIQMYRQTGAVFGTAAANEKEALSLIYPITSAAAMLGVTMGSVVSLAYVMIYDRINAAALPRAGGRAAGAMQTKLLASAFPIMMSTAVQSVFQFLDMATIQYALGRADDAALASAYREVLTLSATRRADIPTYLYGVLNTAADFKNLIPGIAMALGVCAVPAVSGTFEARDRTRLYSLVNTVYVSTVLLCVYIGVFLALCSREVLELFYHASAPDIPVACADLVALFALTSPFYALAGSAVCCVQAIGRAQKSITPYIVSGVLRCILNLLLINRREFLLFGAVIAGAAGYFVMTVWNIFLMCRFGKIGFSVKNVLVKPMFIGSVLLFCMKYLSKFLEFSSSLPINLLTKGAVFSLLFCILCFLMRAVDLTELPAFTKSKKNARNTCN